MAQMKYPKRNKGNAGNAVQRMAAGQQVDPLAQAFWDLFNLFSPPGEGGETTLEKSSGPTKRSAPEKASVGAPGRGQSPATSAQPTDTVYANNAGGGSPFGEAFNTPLFANIPLPAQRPPMPVQAPSHAAAAPMPAMNPAFHTMGAPASPPIPTKAGAVLPGNEQVDPIMTAFMQMLQAGGR